MRGRRNVVSRLSRLGRLHRLPFLLLHSFCLSLPASILSSIYRPALSSSRCFVLSLFVSHLTLPSFVTTSRLHCKRRVLQWRVRPDQAHHLFSVFYGILLAFALRNICRGDILPMVLFSDKPHCSWSQIMLSPYTALILGTIS